MKSKLFRGKLLVALLALSVGSLAAVSALAQGAGEQTGSEPSVSPQAGKVTLKTVLGANSRADVQSCGGKKWDKVTTFPGLSYKTVGKTWQITLPDAVFNANVKDEPAPNCDGFSGIRILLHAVNDTGSTVGVVQKTNPKGVTITTKVNADISATYNKKPAVCTTVEPVTLNLISWDSDSALLPKLVGRDYKKVGANGNAVIVTKKFTTPHLALKSGDKGTCDTLNTQFGSGIDKIGLSWEVNLIPALK